MEIGFLLDASGVRENDAGELFESDHVEIADRVYDSNVGNEMFKVPVGNLLSRTRVHGKQDREMPPNFVEAFEDVSQALWHIRVLGSMYGGQRELLRFEIERDECRARDLFLVPERRIEHHVADHLNGGSRKAFAFEVPAGRGGRCEEQGRDVVRQDAVDLFRRGSVERAQASLDVGNRDSQFRRGQRSG